MNIQAPGIIKTADDFLRWNEGREGKREFVRGRIVEMMTGGSAAHWKLQTRLSRLVGNQLDDTLYDVGTADFGVRTPRGVRYPDVLVVAAGIDNRDLATCHPLIVAEILSPSSLALDFGEKAQEYTAIDGLLHYLVLSQDEPRVWAWSRGEDGAFGTPDMIAGLEASAMLTGLGVSIALADLYRGIVPA